MLDNLAGLARGAAGGSLAHKKFTLPAIRSI